jgi:hypothetical protein
VWLRRYGQWLAGNGSGSWGTPGGGRKLALPDAFRQGHHHGSRPARLNLGPRISGLRLLDHRCIGFEQDVYSLDRVLGFRSFRFRAVQQLPSVAARLFYMCHAISVPPEHVEEGLVTVTRNPDGTPFDWGMVTGDLIQVCVAKHKPKRAAVPVQYHHYWYYIDDADIASKTTLALFRELMRLQKGGAPSEHRVHTLPISGRR